MMTRAKDKQHSKQSKKTTPVYINLYGDETGTMCSAHHLPDCSDNSIIPIVGLDSGDDDADEIYCASRVVFGLERLGYSPTQMHLAEDSELQPDWLRDVQMFWFSLLNAQLERDLQRSLGGRTV